MPVIEPQPRAQTFLTLDELVVLEGRVTPEDLCLLTSIEPERLNEAAKRALEVESPNESVLTAIGATCMSRLFLGHVDQDQRDILTETVEILRPVEN
ncbi:MAG TPA: hypothetical protein VHC21_03465 [Candidatus Saccharimonadales bacterium]|nr:hypothetical protein [Candidatus Saccharimonadales bacterium]